MKKYLSIFELFARNTIYKVILLVLVMGVTEVALFTHAMTEWIPMDYYDLDFQAIEHYTLEYVVDRSNSVVVMAVAFVLLTAALGWSGCNIGSKSSYTLQRLQVSEKVIFVMQSIYNSCCYVVFLGTQVIVFLIQSSLYVAQSENVTNQTVFLAFYRNDFMHSVLPLESTMRCGTNILILIGCGVSAAVFTYLQRRGKMAWSLLVVVACVLLGFVQELGNHLAIVTAILVLSIAGITAYCHVLQKKEREEV